MPFPATSLRLRRVDQMGALSHCFSTKAEAVPPMLAAVTDGLAL